MLDAGGLHSLAEAVRPWIGRRGRPRSEPRSDAHPDLVARVRPASAEEVADDSAIEKRPLAPTGVAPATLQPLAAQEAPASAQVCATASYSRRPIFASFEASEYSDRLLDSHEMFAFPQDVEAGPATERGRNFGACVKLSSSRAALWVASATSGQLEGHQGSADSVWDRVSYVCAPLRRRHLRAPEDRRAGHPATLSGWRSRPPWIADARRPGRRRCRPEGGATDRLAGEGPAAAAEVRRRSVGPGQAGLETAPGGGRA